MPDSTQSRIRHDELAEDEVDTSMGTLTCLEGHFRPISHQIPATLWLVNGHDEATLLGRAMTRALANKTGNSKIDHQNLEWQ